jgi:hypothetical protein
MLIVAAIMGLLIYRHVPKGRHALWRLLKSQKAESHMHAVSVGRDNDDYPVWRAAAPSAVLDSYGIDRESVSVKEGDLKGLLCSPHKDISTLKDLLLYVSVACVVCVVCRFDADGFGVIRYAADRHKGARALGQRKLIKEHKQKKVIHGEEKEWTLYEKSPYEWLTYSQVLTQVKQLSCGILALGIRPVRHELFHCSSLALESKRTTRTRTRHDTQRESVCLFLDTCMEWQLMAHACFHSNLPVATAYASLGKKGLSHALSQTESRALFTHASLFKTVLSPYLFTVCVCGGACAAACGSCAACSRATFYARPGAEEPQEV